MKIAVVGASGKTGGACVSLAAAEGHEVVAVVRDPARFTGTAAAVRTADARDSRQLATAFAGADAVVVSVGHGPDTANDIQAATMGPILDAMRECGIRRLVTITASGPYNEGDNPITRFVAKPILWRIFGDQWRDMEATELLVRASDTDWTIMRPPQLKDGAAKRKITRRIDSNPTWAFTITRADLAQAMLDALGDDSTIGHAIGVAN